MIAQIKMLLKVKTLKQTQAFRMMQAKRSALAEAEQATQAAEAAVAESRASLPAREDAIFSEIIGRAIGVSDVDEAKARVLSLHGAHQILIDEKERCIHVEARARRERDEAVLAYQAATRVVDKYGLITDDLVLAHQTELTAREDGEVEEMFARPRRRIG